MTKGHLITLEGGEGAGKSTQSARLAAFLENKGLEVITTREPGGTEAGEALRHVFTTQNGPTWPVRAQCLLMFTTRCLLLETLILPAIESGKIVICDRFTDSTRVYQGAGLGMDQETIEALKSCAIGDYEPDLTLILDQPSEIGLKRAAHRLEQDDTFEMQDLAFHKRLRQGFLDIADENPQRCALIDATLDIESVAGQIRKTVLDRLELGDV